MYEYINKFQKKKKSRLQEKDQVIYSLGDQGRKTFRKKLWLVLQTAKDAAVGG